jgi:hypothetical protein
MTDKIEQVLSLLESSPFINPCTCSVCSFDRKKLAQQIDALYQVFDKSEKVEK